MGGFGQNITIDYNLRGGPPSKLLQLKLWSNSMFTKLHFFKMWGIKRKQIGGIIFYLIRQLSESLIWELKMIAQLGPSASQAKPRPIQAWAEMALFSGCFLRVASVTFLRST